MNRALKGQTARETQHALFCKSNSNFQAILKISIRILELSTGSARTKTQILHQAGAIAVGLCVRFSCWLLMQRTASNPTRQNPRKHARIHIATAQRRALNKPF